MLPISSFLQILRSAFSVQQSSLTVKAVTIISVLRVAHAPLVFQVFTLILQIFFVILALPQSTSQLSFHLIAVLFVRLMAALFSALLVSTITIW